MFKTGNIPTPIIDTMTAMMLSRTILVATKLNIFEALESGSLTVSEVAKQCGTDEDATKKLLDALGASDYLLYVKGERYKLAPVAKKWLLKSSPVSHYDQMIWRFYEWDLLSNYEDYIRTGEHIKLQGII